MPPKPDFKEPVEVALSELSRTRSGSASGPRHGTFMISTPRDLSGSAQLVLSVRNAGRNLAGLSQAIRPMSRRSLRRVAPSKRNKIESLISPSAGDN